MNANSTATTPEQQAPAAEQQQNAQQSEQAAAPVPVKEPVKLDKIGELVSKDSEGNTVARYVIQNLGGGIQYAEMLGQKVDSTNTELGNVCINKATPDGPDGKNKAGIGTLMFNMNNSNAAPVLDNSEYTVVPSSTNSDTITIQSNDVRVSPNSPAFQVTKTYSLVPVKNGDETVDGNAYVIKVDIKVKNTGNAPLSISNWGLYGGGMCQVNKNEGGFTKFITMDEGDFDDEDDGIFEHYFSPDDDRIYNTDYKNLDWAGLMNQYFATIIQPAQGSGTHKLNAVYIAPA